jgi:hypothetical protein
MPFGFGHRIVLIAPLGAGVPQALSAGAFQFEFQNLGGLQTGVDYPLTSFPSSVVGPSPNLFILAPDLIAAGWAGAFTVTPNGLSVRFTAVPEPSGIALACLPAALFAWAARRRPHGAATEESAQSLQAALQNCVIRDNPLP